MLLISNQIKLIYIMFLSPIVTSILVLLVVLVTTFIIVQFIFTSLPLQSGFSLSNLWLFINNKYLIKFLYTPITIYLIYKLGGLLWSLPTFLVLAAYFLEIEQSVIKVIDLLSITEKDKMAMGPNVLNMDSSGADTGKGKGTICAKNGSPEAVGDQRQDKGKQPAQYQEPTQAQEPSQGQEPRTQEPNVEPVDEESSGAHLARDRAELQNKDEINDPNIRPAIHAGIDKSKYIDKEELTAYVYDEYYKKAGEEVSKKCYVISTNVPPQHRDQIVSAIKERFKQLDDESPILYRHWTNTLPKIHPEHRDPDPAEVANAQQESKKKDEKIRLPIIRNIVGLRQHIDLDRSNDALRQEMDNLTSSFEKNLTISDDVKPEDDKSGLNVLAKFQAQLQVLDKFGKYTMRAYNEDIEDEKDPVWSDIKDYYQAANSEISNKPGEAVSNKAEIAALQDKIEARLKEAKTQREAKGHDESLALYPAEQAKAQQESEKKDGKRKLPSSGDLDDESEDIYPRKRSKEQH